MAATNRNLEEMVKNDRFRSDLLFRLQSFVIKLPSLRERPDDIKVLSRHHTDRICEHYAIPPKVFSPEFMKMLTAHTWTGNVRELVNALECAIAAAHNESILFPKHLPIQLRIAVTQTAMKKELPLTPQPGNNGSCGLPPLNEYRESVYSQAEKQYLQELMAVTSNDLAKACSLSDLSQSRLYALLKKHEVHFSR